MVPRVILTVKYNRREHSEYCFSERGTCLIGRGPDCDLRLPAADNYLMVSRHHCQLEIDPPYVRVRDLGSRNGTRLNGMQIGHPDRWGTPRPDILMDYELHDGDELAMGPAVFEVRAEVPEDCPVHRVDLPNSEPAGDDVIADGEIVETRAPGPAGRC
jgi:pSer/pThr/pTyr-binding forkhead associated (FHA) protein